MKKLLLLALPLLAITFNSCSKDDDGGETGGGNAKLVKSIRTDNEENGGREFTYDSQQHITKVSCDDGYAETYTYGNKSVTVDDNDGENPYSFTLTFDNNGYVTNENAGLYNVEYEYSNGYISKATSPNSTRIYTWTNGNLTKVVSTGEDAWTQTYTYNDVENKLNLNIFEVFYHDVFSYVYFKPKGVSTKNYPVGSKYIENGITRNEYTYSYTYNSEGYPTKIVIFDPSNSRSETLTIAYY